MKLKVFYKGYLRQNKGCFIEILIKIKSKLASNFLEFLLDPYLLIHFMIVDSMKAMQQILTKLGNKIMAHLSQINRNHSSCLLPSFLNLTLNLKEALRGVGLRNKYIFSNL